MISFLKRLFSGSHQPEPQPSASPAFEGTAEAKHRRQRDNAVVYTAKERGRVSLKIGDHMGAIMDTVRTLREYGWNAGWLEPMAADAILTRDAASFVNGFACDEEAARAWLQNNSL